VYIACPAGDGFQYFVIKTEKMKEAGRDGPDAFGKNRVGAVGACT